MGEAMEMMVGKARAGSGGGSSLHGASTPVAQFAFGSVAA
jgi:hypothetical protein